jgi:hypothetical protein
MGNCCAAGSEQGNVEVQKGGRRLKLNELFDDRQVAGYKGADKMILIIKIQALFRGSVARKKVRQRFGFQSKTMGGIRTGYSEADY